MTSHVYGHPQFVSHPSPQDATQEHDELLVIPLWQVGSTAAGTMSCLHLLHTCAGLLMVCNAATRERCPGCGCPICHEHQTEHCLHLCEDGMEVLRSLCQGCAMLPREQVYQLRTLREQASGAQQEAGD
jgi:hypothetical protein